MVKEIEKKLPTKKKMSTLLHKLSFNNYYIYTMYPDERNHKKPFFLLSNKI